MAIGQSEALKLEAASKMKKKKYKLLVEEKES